MIKKIVLAYSGGLDTSVIACWLQEQYRCEVITFTADIGQGEEVEPARAKAEALGIKQIYIEDLREDFASNYVLPMFRANALYEGEYLLGTAIARPLIAKRLVEIARETGADAIAHGATGKGNDQVRFELGAYALQPDIKVIAPWREWTLSSRSQLIEYCKARNAVLEGAELDRQPPYSMDANLLHISYEGGLLEDPWREPEESIWQLTNSIEQTPSQPDYIEIRFQRGDPIALNDERLGAAELLQRLNKIGGLHGIGRLDIVENRYVGMKSRGCYETPGGTILLKAHRAIESITLDREVMYQKDSMIPRYAQLIYNGYWWSPERDMLQKAIDSSQVPVNGLVRLKLHRGNVILVGRQSDNSLFRPQIATFETGGGYQQQDADGFIKLNSLRLRIEAERYADLPDQKK